VSLFGNHHIRGGYDREDLDYSSFTLANGNYQLSYFNSGANGDGTVTTPNTQYVTRRYFQNGGQFSTRGTAYYLQDSWTLFQNRLSLVLGVRNDRFTNKNADGETFFDSKNNWSPRLSVSFDPTGDGQTKVFGAFNRYFVPVATNTNLRLAGPELDYTQYYLLNGLNANNTAIYGAPIAISGSSATACPTLAIEPTPGNVRNCTVNSDGISPPFNSLVSSNLAAQSTDEYQAGIEHRLGSRVRVGAYYTQRKLNESLEDAYIDAGSDV
jgi:outer membrane receptor protein involved in Fe transport